MRSKSVHHYENKKYIYDLFLQRFHYERFVAQSVVRGTTTGCAWVRDNDEEFFLFFLNDWPLGII